MGRQGTGGKAVVTLSERNLYRLGGGAGTGGEDRHFRQAEGCIERETQMKE